MNILRNISLIWKKRELVTALTFRDIKQRYKQSFLGYLWIILVPLLNMIVLTFVFSRVIRVSTGGIPYPIFVYIGLLAWGFFSGALSSSTAQLVSNSSLITKIYFPREILVLAAVLSKAFDLLFASIIFVVLLLVYRVEPSVFILWLPVIFIIQFIFTMGLSLILAALNLFYRDVGNLIGVVLLLWMYLTPIIYPADIFPKKFQLLLLLNPMAAVVDSYRSVLLKAANPNFIFLGVAFIISLLTLVISYLIFKKLENSFADIV